MTAKLIDSISYNAGCISNQTEIEQETIVPITALQVVESNIRGWGSANAIVNIGGTYFLAIVTA